jgi:NADH-quinone oxidoreductase subunit K
MQNGGTATQISDAKPCPDWHGFVHFEFCILHFSFFIEEHLMNLPPVPPELYLILSGILFTIGVIGALTRRNAIIVFMCIELMLNAVNLTFITFSRFLQSMDGVMVAFFVMAVAAAEAAVGLAIFVQVYRSRETINVDEINLLKW